MDDVVKGDLDDAVDDAVDGDLDGRRGSVSRAPRMVLREAPCVEDWVIAQRGRRRGRLRTVRLQGQEGNGSLGTDADRSALRAWAAARGLPAEALGELLGMLGLPAGEGEVVGSTDREPSSADREGEAGLSADQRYEDLGLFGRGAMGEVRRVRDRVLRRVVAMKVLRPELVSTPAAVARFVEEARATAALQHPSIVPVFDQGRLADGRVWFTCRAVAGRQLGALIQAVHAVSIDRWAATADGWSLRRLVATFHSVCQTVGYAHQRGVIHRDLKPANVVVGPHGDVYVVDWGIAKAVGALADPSGEEGTVERSLPSDFHTLLGQITGTPAYMPPEQALGRSDLVDATSDVYALGAVLYELLSGRPPYEGTPSAVLAQVRAGPPAPVGRVSEASTFGWAPELQGGTTGLLPLPEVLVAVCERAMRRAPAERFPSASALAEAVQGWLDGSHRLELADHFVRRARALEAEVAGRRARAATIEAEGEAALAQVPRWAPEALKHEAWAALDAAAKEREQAEADDGEVDELLRHAAQISPEHVDSRAFSAERALRRHVALEGVGDEAGARTARRRLEVERAALPETDPRRLAIDVYLRGDGALTLHTTPSGAEVHLYRYEERHRRLVETWVGSLGPTPIVERALPMGSYMLRVLHPDCEEVRYPVHLARGQHWDGVPPGAEAPESIVLPPRGSVGAHERYVPAGWFWSGDDQPGSPVHPRRRLWAHAFLMDRFPVTNAGFIAFLDALVAAGDVEAALRWVPRDRGRTDGELGPIVYAFDGQHFHLQADADGDRWLPEWPATQLSWDAARAYMDWRAGQSGVEARLPGELEWEKAARGVDGRSYPWGERFDPSWCNMTESRPGRNTPVEVDTFPVDESVYGVRGCAGGQSDWCLERFDGPDPVEGARLRSPTAGGSGSPATLRVLRGGGWLSDRRYCHLATRIRNGQQISFAVLSFRGARRAPIEAWAAAAQPSQAQ